MIFMDVQASNVVRGISLIYIDGITSLIRPLMVRIGKKRNSSYFLIVMTCMAINGRESRSVSLKGNEAVEIDRTMP
jgi:hypothetical protein